MQNTTSQPQSQEDEAMAVDDFFRALRDIRQHGSTERLEAMSAYRCFVDATGDIPEDYIVRYIAARRVIRDAE